MRLAPALLIALASGTANASSLTTDFSDLWYDPTQSGWGVNLIQQRDTIFATLFVYNAANQPEWYVASAVRLVNTDGGVLTFSGDLFRTTGPWFGAATFDPNQVTVTRVGAFAFAAGQVSSGAISYSIDNRQVTKNVQRQTWAAENLTGNYLGASAASGSGCAAAFNGYREATATYAVTHSGNAVSITETQAGGLTCNYAAAWSQSGRMSSLTGTANCSDGIGYAFTASEVQASIQGLAMRFSRVAGNCTIVGRLAGVRRAQ